MWTTQRRDRRTRRRAGLQLECLDDRLVLSAAAGGAAAGAVVHHHHHHHHHHRHHAVVHHAAMAAHRAMAPMTSAEPAAIIAGSGPAGTSGGRVSVSGSGHTVRRVTLTPVGSGFHPGTVNSAVGPRFQMTTFSTGSGSGGSMSTTSDVTTPTTTPRGPLPGHIVTGPDGQPIATVFGDGSASSDSTGATTGATTTPTTTTPRGPLPGHIVTGPDGQPIAAVF